MKIFNVLSTEMVDKLMQLKRAAQGSTVPQTVAGQVEPGNSSKVSRVGNSKGKSSLASRSEKKRASVAHREGIRAHAREVLSRLLPGIVSPKAGGRTVVIQSQLTISQLKEGSRPQVLREMGIVEAILGVVSTLLKKAAPAVKFNKNGIRFI